MLSSKENRCLIIVNKSTGEFLEKTLIREDTNFNLKNTVKDMYKELRRKDRNLEEFHYFFKPMSNINECDMIDSELYCMLYYRKNGEHVLVDNATKKQIIGRAKTLKISLQTDAYESASLYKMSDATDINFLLEVYSKAISEAKKELREEAKDLEN